MIKVERPGGEDTRRMPPLRDGRSLVYEMLNAGEEIIELDLKDPADMERVLDYLARADVLVALFRPGVMVRPGLDPSLLLERHPALVVCSITGYGQGARPLGPPATISTT